MAKTLFSAVPGSRLENRGQRSLASLVSKARRSHLKRLCSIHSFEGKPRAISFLEIGEKNGWKRLSPRISITKISLPKEKTKLSQSRCLEITGAKAATLSALISPSNSSDETESRIASAPKKLSIFVANKKLLELGVAYGK